MNPPGHRSGFQSRVLPELIWLAITAMVCAHFSLNYNLNNRPFLSLPRYTAGLENLPYQARVLMAWVFRAFADKPLTSSLAARLPFQLHDPYVFIQLIVSFLALLGAVAFTRGSISILTSDSSYSRWAALLVAFMAYFNLPLIYGLSYTLPYDVPSLFFFSACIYCVLNRLWPAFYFFFILGTFNRETICFVTLFYVIWVSSQAAFQQNRTRIWPIVNTLAQAAVWIGIKIYLKHRFAHNSYEHGGSALFVPHLAYNVHEILKTQQWPLLLSNFGFMLPLLIAQRAFIANRGISRACAIILPLWLALMFYVGVIVEIRIFTELIALVAIAIALIVFNRWVQPVERPALT